MTPGAIDIDFGGGAVRDNAGPDAVVAGQTALGRAGKPEEIVFVVAFVCSDARNWGAGRRLEVSGGMFR